MSAETTRVDRRGVAPVEWEPLPLVPEREDFTSIERWLECERRMTMERTSMILPFPADRCRCDGAMRFAWGVITGAVIVASTLVIGLVVLQ